MVSPYLILYSEKVVAMASEEGKKKKIIVTIVYALLEWLENEVKAKRFGTKSYGVELTLSKLKEEVEKDKK